MKSIRLKFNYHFAYRQKDESGATIEVFEPWQEFDRTITADVPERKDREEFVLKLLLADPELKPRAKWTKFEFASYLAIPTKRERPAEVEPAANTAPA